MLLHEKSDNKTIELRFCFCCGREEKNYNFYHCCEESENEIFHVDFFSFLFFPAARHFAGWNSSLYGRCNIKKILFHEKHIKCEENENKNGSYVFNQWNQRGCRSEFGQVSCFVWLILRGMMKRASKSFHSEFSKPLSDLFTIFYYRKF